ncbi:16S rRNA (uracil1498-N3)-methyltransferase [Sanguibacter gelidistatuariae]|uniref:Ribosomal RNA small subunit methyltransferase E n=1 Tax=Sanguibacter gelidistatuariae TaxID=1814289 RepID=A0A1G6S003_9MICO|nr:16S rRNA (uracil(1498)-N(3))-methyltransferase [Sanguibacter gelidistatuariae]SDD09545.1 16S rRNA (uracil1498-N3)-methyltransferase [Sanguibacter gelidistatuariae]
MSAPVFLAAPGALFALAPGDTYVLDGDEGRHAGVVQRRGAGERIDVVDGAGLRLETVVAAVDAGRLELTVTATRTEAPDGVELVLVQALAKGDRDELAIEAATEVGVDAVQPWQAERSVVVWRGDRAAKSRARWVTTVRAATKQARRASLPAVGQVIDGKGLAATVAEVHAAGGLTVVLHEDAELPLAGLDLPAAGGAGAPVRRVLIVVGPEGGISDREVAALTDAGAVLARLGPHVLRTSTAGPIAIALLSQRLGRWG